MENTNTVRYDLLERTCKKVEKLPRKRFDFSNWVQTGKWKGKKDLSCGTSACFVGWATTLPSVRKTGLFLSGNCGNPTIRGAFKNFFDDEANAKAFGLTIEEAAFLFRWNKTHPDYAWTSPPMEATGKQVVAHVRRFVNAHKVLHNDLNVRTAGI